MLRPQHRKGYIMNSIKLSLAGSAIVLVAVMSAAPAYAQATCGTYAAGAITQPAEGDPSGPSATACGAGAVASGGGGVAVGNSAGATGSLSTAVGAFAGAT